MNKIDYFVLTLIFGTLTLSVPSVFAQDNGAVSTIIGSIETIASIVNKLLPILVALTIIFFVYRLVIVIFTLDKNENVKDNLISSILIMFVVFSIWGIVALLQAATGTKNSIDCSGGDSRYGKILFDESSFKQTCG